MVVRRKQDHKEQKEKVRRALLAATLRLAAPYGFASLSLREVAREAGISPTSFYRHFEDMEQLGLVLVEDSVGPLLIGLVEPCRREAKKPWDVPNLFIREMFATANQDPDLLRFFFAERVGGSETARTADGVRVDVLIDELRDAMRSVDPKAEPITPAVAEAVVVHSFEAARRALDANAEHRQAALDIIGTQLKMIETGVEQSDRERGK